MLRVFITTALLPLTLGAATIAGGLLLVTAHVTALRGTPCCDGD